MRRVNDMATTKEIIEERDRLVVWLKCIANRYGLKWTYTFDDYDYPIFRLIFPNKVGDYFYKIQISFWSRSFNTTYYMARNEANCGNPISQKSWRFVEYPKKRFAPVKDSSVLFEDWVMDIIKKLLKESEIVFTKEMIFGIFNEEYSKIGGTCIVKPMCHSRIGDNHHINEYVVINGKNCGPKVCIIRDYDNGSWFTFSGIDEITGHWRYVINSKDTEDDIRYKAYHAVIKICTGLRDCHNRLFASGATMYLEPSELRYIDHDENILYKVMCAIKENTNNMNIKKVIFNNPATIVLWEDGTKTVVKRQKGERWDKEKGLAMAIVKKISGNTGNYNDIFKKWCEE